MHGRIKVKTTAEQDEARRIERDKKLKLYNFVTARVFQKRAAGEYDEEALSLSAELLQRNPDFSTLWNIRRQILMHFMMLKKEGMQVMFDQELSFLETCLKVNPKSYCSWHHRQWVMKSSPHPNWERELCITTQFLAIDERNFHCWDYRRFIAECSKVSPMSELEFTASKISTNFSNYSAWHYRSKLLPAVHPDESVPAGISTEALLEESSLVQNAVFTDPNDQSAWFYHRWLLGRPLRKLDLSCLYANRTERLISATFTKKVLKDKLLIQINNSDIQLDWKSPNNDLYSQVWVANYSLCCEDTICVEYCGQENAARTLRIASEATEESWSCDLAASSANSEPTKFSSAVLKQELDYCMQLYELEPQNKWVLLTIVLLMKEIDFEAYKDQVLCNLDALAKVDGSRRRYYEDLCSCFIIERTIRMMRSSTRSVSLQGLRLTQLCHLEKFSIIQTLDISNNNLTSLSHVNSVQSLKRLDAANNKITSCQGLANMPCLEHLCLANNNFKELLNLTDLTSCSKLSAIDLRGNRHLKPLEKDVKCLLKQVQTLHIL